MDNALLYTFVAVGLFVSWNKGHYTSPLKEQVFIFSSHCIGNDWKNVQSLAHVRLDLEVLSISVTIPIIGTPGCKFYVCPHMCFSSGDYDFVFAKDAFKHGESVPCETLYSCETLDSPLVLSYGRGDSKQEFKNWKGIKTQAIYPFV